MGFTEHFVLAALLCKGSFDFAQDFVWRLVRNRILQFLLSSLRFASHAQGSL
jgi:hypothetical protein